jgi:hypothetical protein
MAALLGGAVPLASPGCARSVRAGRAVAAWCSRAPRGREVLRALRCGDVLLSVLAHAHVASRGSTDHIATSYLIDTIDRGPAPRPGTAAVSRAGPWGPDLADTADAMSRLGVGHVSQAAQRRPRIMRRTLTASLPVIARQAAQRLRQLASRTQERPRQSPSRSRCVRDPMRANEPRQAHAEWTASQSGRACPRRRATQRRAAHYHQAGQRARRPLILLADYAAQLGELREERNRLAQV